MPSDADRIRELEEALSHVLEFIPSDAKCETCAAVKKLAYECNSKEAKELDRSVQQKSIHTVPVVVTDLATGVTRTMASTVRLTPPWTED